MLWFCLFTLSPLPHLARGTSARKTAMHTQSKQHFADPSTSARRPRRRPSSQSHLLLTRTSAVASLALALALGGITPAVAGPDDGKYVATQGHVDAPKAFWENGNFALKSEANLHGNGPEDVPLEQTVNWVGKGWSGEGEGLNQYIFTTDGHPALEWLGEPGRDYYMAPQLPRYNQDPIWAGLGADSAIPVEEFRDGTFATDILSVNGPGTMDLFRFTDWGTKADARRMLSSTSLGLHSYLLHQGTHSHNYTLFSKPGRYEVTYRTVARSADGSRAIASEPTTLVWQVGGQKPVSGEGVVTSVSTQDRYNAAPTGDLSSADYQLSLAPHTGRENAGDEKLTDISFSSGSAKSGTLTLFINGYFLTDLEVKDGKAVWPEMLGSENSQIQAVFTPAEGEDDAARWISAPLEFVPGGAASISSSSGNGDWPVEIPDARNTVLPTSFYTPTSGDYTVTVEPTGDPNISKLRVEFKDKNFRGFIGGGLFSKGEEVYPDLAFNSVVTDGVAEQYFEASKYMNGTFPRVDVIPHPDMNAATSSVKLENPFENTTPQSGSGSFEVLENAEAPAPVDPEEPTAEPSEEAAPAPSSEPSAPGDPSEPTAPGEPTEMPAEEAPAEEATESPAEPSDTSSSEVVAELPSDNPTAAPTDPAGETAPGAVLPEEAAEPADNAENTEAEPALSAPVDLGQGASAISPDLFNPALRQASAEPAGDQALSPQGGAENQAAGPELSQAPASLAQTGFGAASVTVTGLVLLTVGVALTARRRRKS